MTILNFSHPLPSDYIAAIETVTGSSIEDVRDLRHNFDAGEPFIEQARLLADAAGLNAHEWQTLSLLVNLPPLSVIAGLVLAEIHGRRGGFPRILRSQRNMTTDQYEFAEILALQNIRDDARQRAVHSYTSEDGR